MRKAPVLHSKSDRVVLRHGTRAVLYFERELPAFDCVAARHAKEISDALLAHAERVYLPVAATELEQMVGEGRGYAFSPHRLVFRARITSAGAGLRMHLSLSYTVGDEVQMAQTASSLWTADGAYRCRRVPRVRKTEKKAVEK